MQLYVYNTLSHSIELFVPIDPHKVKLYSCGPTVYSRQHLGNLRAAYVVDLLKNTLKYVCGYETMHVMNITDVGHLTGDNEGDADHGEDRMEKGAKQQGITARDVAKKFTDIYNEDLQLLRIDPFDVMPKATEHIMEQIHMIQDLEKKGYTYSIDGDGIYVDTSKVEHYGVLTNKKHLEHIEIGSRVQDVGKKRPSDFALRKYNVTGKKRDMEWDSPRGVGFPGWHIECSAMSMAYLGDHIDIHTGGMEHVAIHHTNEICQSECSGAHHPRVNYWIHYQWLMMNGRKIAKSDGNTAFLNEVLEKGYASEDLRYFYLQAHYRSFQDFTREALEGARKGRLSLIKKMQDGLYPDAKQEEEIIGELLQDLNTGGMLGKIHSYGCPKWLDEKVLKIGLFHIPEKVITVIPEEVIQLAEQRRKAKSEKDWTLSDVLRKKIQDLGWNMEDAKDDYTLKKI